jgi:hypothetical protein
MRIMRRVHWADSARERGYQMQVWQLVESRGRFQRQNQNEVSMAPLEQTTLAGMELWLSHQMDSHSPRVLFSFETQKSQIHCQK